MIRLSKLIHRLMEFLFPTSRENTSDVSNPVKYVPSYSSEDIVTSNSSSLEPSVSDDSSKSKPQPSIIVRPTQDELLLEKINEARLVLGSVEGRTPDNQQMLCVIAQEHNHLVIAGAGTGKTSTIVAKVMYLLKTQQYAPNELAIFSFTKASASELKNRIRNATGSQIYTATFHAMALRIVSSVERCTPKINNSPPEAIIKQMLSIQNLTKNEIQTVCKYVLLGGDHIRSEFSFLTASDYLLHLDQHLPRTIDGQKVSNYGELVISNLLTIYGIDYIYYPKTHNFLIAGHNLYIEYYSINHNGDTPCYFFGNQHNATIQSSSKELDYLRNQYRSNAKVIQCYSYQLFDGSLEHYLIDTLQKYGINGSICDSQALWDYAFVQRPYLMTRLAKNISSIMTLMSSKNCSVQDLSAMIDKTWGTYCINPHFFSVLDIFHTHYDQILSATNSTTFDMLLAKATHYIKTGKYIHRYKYVIVDEYQDISQAQYDFLQALRHSHSYSLLAVGDDWQSIYGFNGSRVSYIMDFEQYWGPSYISKIETTYRFPQSLVDIGGKFIMQNPRQIQKNIHAKTTIHDPLAILYADKKTPSISLVAQALDTLPLKSSVFLLGRNNKDWEKIKEDSLYFEDGENGSILYSRRPDLSIQYMSVHSSKGLEADNVILINVIDDRYGFPNQTASHPVVDLLIDLEDPYPHAEERRLFYVAMTRTRNRVFIITERGKESVFVHDLIRDNPDIIERSTKCPRCGRALNRIDNPPFSYYDVCSGYDAGNCEYMVRCNFDITDSPH